MSKFPILLLACGSLIISVPASAQTDREAIESMQHTASVACPGYSTDRANAVIARVPPGALRVLIKHNAVLCPDRRLEANQAVIWYPDLGALVWNATDPQGAATMAQIADRLTRKEDFPQALTVWDAKGNPMKDQVAPQFDFKPTYRHR